MQGEFIADFFVILVPLQGKKIEHLILIKTYCK
jgi:hypothetical protein